MSRCGCILVDGRTGLTPQDKIIADRLRQSPRPVYLAVNKGEGGNRAVLAAEFYELAFGRSLCYFRCARRWRVLSD